MLGGLRKIFGSQNQRELKALWPLVEEINTWEERTKALSNDELKAKTPEFRQRLENGENEDDLLPEAFATIREASVRVLGMRHFDVQLLGGIVLHQGKIAEMKTGEGKTLTATCPVYLNAISGKGVHVVTVNDYLAKRDAEWMDQVYSYMGLSTGVALNGLEYDERIAAYACDITYGQNNEFGFDYLRDNMKLDLAERVQRSHHFAIVDEVDSILIDESRTPLIISGPSEKATDTYHFADQVVRKLTAEAHYVIDLKSKQPTLTEEGVAEVEKIAGIDNLYDPRNLEMLHHVNQALKAHVTMVLDVDYVVRGGEILIVDEFTGRLMAGRRWSDGLHQAVEAKEGVQIQRENQTLATITFQNYFRMYDKLAGMTGTADTEAVEFKKIYNLDVIIVPTNEPMIRDDRADIVYPSERGKFRAVVREIKEIHETGQPILVGTASIAKSEVVSHLLQKEKVPHKVLNAKHHEGEAFIVAQAGRIGSVTISTNMAGRGTDIVLGGNPEFLAVDAAETDDPQDEEFQAQLEHFKEVCAGEKQEVLTKGGLHILGTERHESRRIDNQLRGRAGRQGDPGTSQFYVSLEDDLMKRFGGERMQALMTRVGLQEDDAIEGAIVARAIENAQKKVEGHHFDVRKHLLEYDDVMNKQREVIYDLRESILSGSDEKSSVKEMVGDITEDIVMAHCDEKDSPLKWDISAMILEFNRIFGMDIPAEKYLEQQEQAESTLAQEIFDELTNAAMERFAERSNRFGNERMKKLQQIVHLQAIDHFWKEHLTNMDHLKEGIGLRGYGQKNPLHEYQREAFFLFNELMASVKVSLMQNLFIPDLPSEEELADLEQREKEALRAREQAAAEIHEDASLDSGEGGAAGNNSGKNRRARRREQAATVDDRVPVGVETQVQKSKKVANRKKRKAAKKNKRKSR